MASIEGSIMFHRVLTLFDLPAVVDFSEGLI